jgi:hypothetical protein
MPNVTHHSASDLSKQLNALLTQSWEQEVVARLPAQYEQQARQTGAFVRARGLRGVADLLRGVLAYVLCAPSFRQVGAWAVLIGLANLSHVAWQKRLRQARAWLLWLLSECLAVSSGPAPLPGGRIVLIDATRLTEPGGTGDDWRVHLGYDLLAGRLLDVKISDGHTAEGLTLFALQAGDVVVADRGSCRRKQLASALQAGAQVVVRLVPHQVPLCDPTGKPVDVRAWVKRLSTGQGQCQGAFEYAGRRLTGRLVAWALPEEAAQHAREKERKKAVKQQRQLKEETLDLCGWLLLFTSLSPEQWSDDQVLALYRARWQIELVIKRMKQLLRLAQLRGQTAATNEATLLAVLLCWALIQSEAQAARQILTAAQEHWRATHDQDPGGPPDAAAVLSPLSVSSWSVTALAVTTLRLLVQGGWTFAHLRACLPDLHRFLGSRRWHRAHQESCIRRLFLAHPGLALAASPLVGGSRA